MNDTSGAGGESGGGHAKKGHPLVGVLAYALDIALKIDREQELAFVRVFRERHPTKDRRALADLDNYRKRTERETRRQVSEARQSLLLDWLDEAEIDRLGCFKYEPVAGASSNALEGVVPDEVKQQRYNALMARQQKISARRLKRKVGTRQQVIIDEVGPTVARGRSKADAPEIDGSVYLSSRRPLKVGEIVTARIERADEYDLHGSVAGF